MYNVIFGMCIPRVKRMKEIWGEVFFKLIVYFDGLVIVKKLLLDYIHRIETHIDVVIEVLEFHSSFAFELYLDEEFIELW